MRYFSIFANCMIIQGSSNLCVYDLQRGVMYQIPKFVGGLLGDYGFIPIESIITDYDSSSSSHILKVLHFLEEKELGFFCDNPTNFPPLAREFNYPSIISNVILFLNSKSEYYLKKVIGELNILICKHIEIRLCDYSDCLELETIMSYFCNSTIRSIELHLMYSNMYEQQIKQISKFGRVLSIVFYNAPLEDFVSSDSNRLVRT